MEFQLELKLGWIQALYNNIARCWPFPMLDSWSGHHYHQSDYLLG